MATMTKKSRWRGGGGSNARAQGQEPQRRVEKQSLRMDSTQKQGRLSRIKVAGRMLCRIEERVCVRDVIPRGLCVRARRRV